MSDARSSDAEQLLGLVARGVQRMADSLGSLEQRLGGLARADQLDALQQAPAGRPVWVDELAERIAIVERRVADRPAGDAAGGIDDEAADRLVAAVRGLRDDVVVAIGELRAETTTWMERLLTEQSNRLTRVHEALSSARADPASPARFDDLQQVLDEVRDEVRTVHGEIVSNAGQLRTDLAAEATVQRDRLVDAIRAVPIAEDRFTAIERVIASLRDELAIDRLESSLRDMAEDTSGLRADVRRSFDRVLHEISTTEESLKGEVRAIDHRLTGFGEDLRLVRGLRDGLEALAAGVDGVRQLAARSATSSQMGELAADLSTVLAEIETARAQVLSVDQHVGRAQAGAIEVSPTGDVTKSVEDLERTVTEEMADLGARIEALAERAVGEQPVEDPIARRLRSLATSARQLGMGITEDVRARRKSRSRRA
jgi:hypothetical protein